MKMEGIFAVRRLQFAELMNTKEEKERTDVGDKFSTGSGRDQ